MEGVNIGVSDTCMKLSCSTGLTGQEGKMPRPACCLWSVTGCISLRRDVQECIEVEGLGCPESAWQARTVQLNRPVAGKCKRQRILDTDRPLHACLSAHLWFNDAVACQCPCAMLQGQTPPRSTDCCPVHAQVQPSLLKSQQVPATAADLCLVSAEVLRPQADAEREGADDLRRATGASLQHHALLERRGCCLARRHTVRTSPRVHACPLHCVPMTELVAAEAWAAVHEHDSSLVWGWWYTAACARPA